MTEYTIHNTQKSMEDLIKNMKESNKVFYTRFGDGEIFIMDGKDTNRHRAEPNMSAEMAESINIQDPYYMKAISLEYPVEPGMRRGVFMPYLYRKKKLIKAFERHLKTKETIFYNPVCFHYYLVFKTEEYIDFMHEHIRPKKKLFIGNAHEMGAKKAFGCIDYYFPTVFKDAYYTAHNWWSEVEKTIQENDIELVVLCVGAAANCFQARLWKIDKPFHSIDFGSVVDPYTKDMTRTWLKEVYDDLSKKLERIDIRWTSQ